MRVKYFCIISVVIGLMHSSAMAALPPDVWYFATTLKRITPDDNRQLNAKSGAQYLFGRTFGQFNTVDIGFDETEFNSTTGAGSAKQSSIDLTYRRLFEMDTMQWFMLLSAGQIDHRVSGQAFTNASASLGAGLLYSMWDKGPAISADLRFRRHFDKDSNTSYETYDDLSIGLTVTIPFYTEAYHSMQHHDHDKKRDEHREAVAALIANTVVEIEAVTPEKGQIKQKRYGEKFVDNDQDGINDDVDKCLNTPVGAPISVSGCALDTDGDSVADFIDACMGTPRGIKVDDRGCGFDSDGDGVANFRDKCLNSKAEIVVDGNGCELDSDNDGVADSQDQCSGTPPNVVVEPMGCHLTELVILQGVNFKTGSHELGAEAKKVLTQMSETLNRHPKMRVEIAGHTDSTGTDGVNKGLSMQRASSTRNFLVQLGINGKVLSTKGYASEEPVAANDTEKGRLQNRRVELRIVEVD